MHVSGTTKQISEKRKIFSKISLIRYFLDKGAKELININLSFDYMFLMYTVKQYFIMCIAKKQHFFKVSFYKKVLILLQYTYLIKILKR